MALARRFEDLRAWQAARVLTMDVYALSRSAGFDREFALVDQIRRAAASTMNNIAEGFDSASRGDFVRFLRYASRSASEVQSCLHVALDQQYVSRQQFDMTHARAASVRRLCSALIRSLRRRDDDPSVREPAPPAYGFIPAAPPVPAPPVTGQRSPVTPF